MKKTTPRFIIHTTGADIRCLLLAKLGFSLKAIARECKLTESQVAYRLSRAKISPREYRNGISPVAKDVIGMTQQHTVRFMDEIKSEMKRIASKSKSKDVIIDV